MVAAISAVRDKSRRYVFCIDMTSGYAEISNAESIPTFLLNRCEAMPYVESNKISRYMMFVDLETIKSVPKIVYKKEEEMWKNGG